MRVKMVLFDLDGTLLPMDQDVFVEKHFELLTAKLEPYGYEKTDLTDAVWSGMAAMVNNDGGKTNEQAFWDDLIAHYGEKAKRDIPLFMSFYENEFDGVKSVCGCNPQAAETVKRIKEKGMRVALATNPIFPATATKKRMRWAGFSEKDFEWYTTYENSTFCKPNPAYYLEVAKRLSVRPEECLMVGNDAEEDLAARKIGMDVFLLTDCLLNRHDADISGYARGGFQQLRDYIGV